MDYKFLEKLGSDRSILETLGPIKSVSENALLAAQKAAKEADKRVVTAGALLLDQESNIMVLRVSYRSTGAIPGGVLHRLEKPKVGAEREILEELGIKVKLGRVLCMASDTVFDNTTDALRVIFEGPRMTDDLLSQISFADKEVIGYHFVPVDQLDKYLAPNLARLVEHAYKYRFKEVGDSYCEL
jgi:ADP-ribose pyrophosphatase YjhB (NUDIX family)